MPASRTSAALTTLGIAAAALSLPSVVRAFTGARRGGDDVYAELATPSWAPPAWAFPVAWSVNTVALAWAQRRVYRDRGNPRRAGALRLLGAHWLLYGTFSSVYFDARSPAAAAAWTLADFAVCHAAFYRLLPVDRPAALAFAPVNLWLTVALPLSLYQAAANRDPYVGTLGVEIGEIAAGALGLTPVPAARPD